MKYSVAEFECQFNEEWEEAVFLQELADIGFDYFEDTEESEGESGQKDTSGTEQSELNNTDNVRQSGQADTDTEKQTQQKEDNSLRQSKKAYIQSDILDEEKLQEVTVKNKGVKLLGIRECEDRNWNSEWEAEHPIEELALGVKIAAHCAFGNGRHETTSMITETLIKAVTDEKICIDKVLDNGCGTGVIGIMALKLGSQHVTMVDIDEHSTTNTSENCALNGCDMSTVDIVLAGTPPSGQYDLIASNIHRNILIKQMPLYAQYIKEGGEVWLSGFYDEDCEKILSEAAEHGLKMKSKQERNKWILLRLYRPRMV